MRGVTLALMTLALVGCSQSEPTGPEFTAINSGTGATQVVCVSERDQGSCTSTPAPVVAPVVVVPGAEAEE